MTDAMTRGARGGGLILAGQAAKLLIQFASVVILSRMLGPEAFGLIAMVAAFVALGELIRDFGTAVVGLQRKDLSHQQASNLFWLSTGLGTASAVLLAASTPLLVALYNEPRLAGIVPALAVGILLNAMASQLQVQLARAMRFTRLAIADATAPAAGLTAAVVGALSGWGYWSLVAQVLTTAAVGLVLRWIASGWLPSRPRRGADNRAMVGDSAAFGLAQFLTYVSSNLDAIVIGARWDAASLGAYNRAYQLLTMPLNSMMGPLTDVVIPTIHRAREEGRTADSVLLKLQFGLGFIVIWVYSISAAVAGWLIPFALGAAWHEAVPIFQIFAVGGSVWVFSRVSYWAFIASNLGRELLRYNLITKTLASLMILGASFISIEAVAWAVSVGLIVSWPINLIWLAKTAAQDSWRYFWNGVRLLLAGAAGYAAAWGITRAEAWPSWIGSALAVVVGTGVYVAVAAATREGRREGTAALALARRVLRRGRS